MSFKKDAFFLMCVFLTTCESAFVDTLQKCALKDNECHRNVYQTVIKSIAKTGVPELDITPFDPIPLHGVSVSIMDMVNLTMVDGFAKGIKDCVFDSFEIDIEKEKGMQEITCDLLIKGRYKLSANSPLIKDLLGNGELSGEGDGKVKLEKIHVTIVFPFYPIKKDDGEIYMKCVHEDVDYKFDILGKASFAADTIYLGKENISEVVVKYLNENWKVLTKTFGKAFLGKAMELYFDLAQNFFDRVAAKYYITDDLNPYLKN